MFGSEAPRPVIDFTAGNLRMHVGKLIRKSERCPGYANRERLVRVQRIEPDAGSSSYIADVRSKIQLQKVRNSRNHGKPRGAYPTHEEWHDSDPSPTVERLHLQSLWQSHLDAFGCKRPMNE